MPRSNPALPITLPQASGKKVLAFVLAGGEGKRLHPLTRDRAKPAVPFGGRYRIIDIVLSNLVNSGLFQIVALTQYKSDSLHRHIRRVWNLGAMIGQYVECVPAQMRVGQDWYRGSAHAVWQNLYILGDERPDCVAIFGGDHIYHMDVRQMLDFHREKQAECTVAAISYPRSQSSGFGICDVDANGKLIGFVEKPKNPPPMPNQPDRSLVSMGNYIFDARVLRELCEADAKDPTSSHDFGKDILPKLVQRGNTCVYDFNQNQIPGDPRPPGMQNYWRDIGTIDSYFDASMDLIGVVPQFNLYNGEWPTFADSRNMPAAKFVFANAKDGRVGHALDSMVSEGCVVSGGSVEKSLLFPNVRVNSYAELRSTVVFEGVDVGRHAMLKNCIIEKRTRILPGTRIGYDLEADRRRFTVSDAGVVVVPPDVIVGPDEVQPIPEHTPLRYPEDGGDRATRGADSV